MRHMLLLENIIINNSKLGFLMFLGTLATKYIYEPLTIQTTNAESELDMNHKI